MDGANELRVAIEGCGHGTLNAIYRSIEKACQTKGWDGVDVLIIGGDFQAVRNASDLNCMAVPIKYREIGDFHEYYSGARAAPYLTIFIGGNHEASNHLWELHYGGWVAPNIYYLGAANVVKVGPLRISGQSGIWKGYNYRKPHYERLPYNNDDVRSIYHVRELDTRKLLQVRSQVDVGLSHDWPNGIEWMGDWKTLFRKKDQFEAEAREGSLGSVAAKLVLDRLRPPYWFSAHMHIKFPAIIDHTTTRMSESASFQLEAVATPGSGTAASVPRNEEEIDLDMDDEPLVAGTKADTSAPRNEDEIDLDDDDDNEVAVPEVKAEPSVASVGNGTAGPATPVIDTVGAELRAQLPASFARPKHEPVEAPIETPTSITNTVTHFLALDKCLPNRSFLQLLSISPSTPDVSTIEGPLTRPLPFSYDPEWLAITRVFAPELHVGDPTAQVPRDKGRAHYLPLIAEAERWVEDNITSKAKLTIPLNFTPTAPAFDPSHPVLTNDMPREYNNPQTSTFCALLDIPNPFAATEEEIQARVDKGPRPEEARGGFGGGRGGRGGRGDGGGRGFGRGGRGGRGGGRGGRARGGGRAR